LVEYDAETIFLCFINHLAAPTLERDWTGIKDSAVCCGLSTGISSIEDCEKITAVPANHLQRSVAVKSGGASHKVVYVILIVTAHNDMTSFSKCYSLQQRELLNSILLRMCACIIHGGISNFALLLY